MASQSLAKRYARALSELSGEEDTSQEVADSLSRITAALSISVELKDALLNPVFPIQQRMDTLRGVSEYLKLDDVTARFLFVLLQNKRFDHVQMVEKIFKRLVDRKLNRIQIDVSSAHPVDKKISKNLEKVFETLTNREASVRYQIDPQLIGGLVFKIGSLVFDSSIANQLDSLALSFRREL
ncbi:MAG: ATP synthase F1 subunit delta [Deltaproteobacteria bacterium RIFCSPHIGHO2_12_FULL_43_9]|nr:MAG: ATP synthase F1 subunit delta [Deltaproteobacteria bacterium RIFCSPHIGHO2_12_FULL_43_9]